MLSTPSFGSTLDPRAKRIQEINITLRRSIRAVLNRQQKVTGDDWRECENTINLLGIARRQVIDGNWSMVADNLALASESLQTLAAHERDYMINGGLVSARKATLKMLAEIQERELAQAQESTVAEPAMTDDQVLEKIRELALAAEKQQSWYYYQIKSKYLWQEQSDGFRISRLASAESNAQLLLAKEAEAHKDLSEALRATAACLTWRSDDFKLKVLAQLQQHIEYMQQLLQSYQELRQTMLPATAKN